MVKFGYINLYIKERIHVYKLQISVYITQTCRNFVNHLAF